MFKSVDLSMFIIFFVIFHNDKPVDWLLEHLIQTKLCRFDKDLKECKKQKDLVWLHHKPSLFQHIGTHSSLKGKVQKLRDRGFGKLSLYYPHKDNPMAEVSTTLKEYKGHSIDRCYFGETFFWGMSPKKGDNITFTFVPPIYLERYAIIDCFVCLFCVGAVGERLLIFLMAFHLFLIQFCFHFCLKRAIDLSVNRLSLTFSESTE
jgi:alpha-1,3-mannosylglycoprotein beta-1,4-N-acetylglucosaminyltransferase A/B